MIQTTSILGIKVERREIAPMVAAIPFSAMSGAASSKKRSSITCKQYRLADNSHPDNVWRDYADMKFVIEDFRSKGSDSIYSSLFDNPPRLPHLQTKMH